MLKNALFTTLLYKAMINVKWLNEGKRGNRELGRLVFDKINVIRGDGERPLPISDPIVS